MEQRKPRTRSSSLPVDYLQMVSEVFTNNFESGLKTYEQLKPHPRFETRGEVFTDEIVLAVSLINEGQLSATTVHASTDFDPKASAPTIQDLLSACVDAIGTVFGTLLLSNNPEIIAQLAEESMSALENVPYSWTAMDINQRQIFIKVDKSNPQVDSMADEWLRKNDPDLKNLEEQNELETEKLFVTGPRKPNSGSGSGIVH